MRFEHLNLNRNSVILTEKYLKCVTFRFIASMDIGSEVERGETVDDITYRYKSNNN